MNRNLPIHLFTYLPTYPFTHSPIHPPLHPPLVRGGWGGKKGITLIELVIGMVLIGIIALVVANALSTGIDAFFTTDNRKEALDQGRIALDRMAKEIRNVRNASAITTATATTFTFTDTSGTSISFALNTGNGNIERTSGSTNALATGISSIGDATFLTGIFSYVQTDGTITQTPTLSSIKRIKIGFKATSGSESLTLQTEVWPRNL